jgi:SPP1 family phage portal protein
MLTPEEIKTFIDNDRTSKKKQLARVGQRYYEAEHDIRDYRLFWIDQDGQVQEDKHRSNIKISHPFFTELVDQEVQYMLSGKDGFMKSDDTDLQPILDEYFNENEDFLAELYEVLTGCISKGFEYMYAYKGEDDKFCFQAADSMGVVEVRAKETDDHCEYVIWWFVDSIGKDNKQITRIQVWDTKEIHYFVQEDDGEIKPDDSYKENPRPHTMYKKGKDESEKIYFKDFGFIPFFRLDNNRKQVSDLKSVKDLIDDYDLMACGLSNNIQDSNETLFVVKGFEGDNLDELQFNVKTKKIVGVDEDGDVETRVVDIPVEARKTKLELDEKNIYRFGFGLNTAGLKDTSATTNIAIKSAYSLLDLKVNKLEIRLKQFLRKLLHVVLAEVNEKHNKDYQQKDVYFTFDREVMTNAEENARIELTEAQRKQTEIGTLLNIASYLDNETLMQNVCDVLEIDYNEIKSKLPDPNEGDPYQVQTALDAIQTEDEPVGGDVIE